MSGISRHPIIVTEEVDGEIRETVYGSFFTTSNVPIRIRVIPHMRQDDLPTMYSGMAWWRAAFLIVRA